MSWLVFDCASGISGDMTLGALVDLGVPVDDIEQVLRTLPLAGWSLRVEHVTRSSIAATRVHVELEHGHAPTDDRVHASKHAHGRADTHRHEHAHTHEDAHEHTHEPGGRHGPEHALSEPQRHLGDVLEILRAGSLSPRALAWAEAVFERLAQAEATVHRMPVEQVHFHEVGAVDAIVDIAGAAVGLDLLCKRHQVDHMRVSQLRIGRGQVRTEHGTMPVPAPAVLKLLEGFPVQWSDGEGERVTPTGAAILAALTSPLGDAVVQVQATGYGAGAHEFADAPNVLRLLRVEPARPEPATAGAVSGKAATVLAAEATAESTHVRQGQVAVLQTTIDDMVPELFGHLMNRLFESGALDVQYTPVQAKKSRPATHVTVIARTEDTERLVRVLLHESTTLGVRVAHEQRYELERRSAEVTTPFGPVQVKIATRPDGTARVVPEYESVRRVAEARGVAAADVYAAALRAVAGEP